MTKLLAKQLVPVNPQDPNRFVIEPCEFCGLTPTIRWYDCCCDEQHQKYIKEFFEYADYVPHLYDI